MRTFRLSSPEMRGEDVRELQKVLNERLAHYHEKRYAIKENGIYDRETAHAVALIAKALGLHHYDGIPEVTRLIEHPDLRTPAEHVAAKMRATDAKKVDTILTKPDGTGEIIQGLARIPLLASHYLGVHEDPQGSNWGTPYPADWEKNFGFDSGVPWCGCFSCSMVNAAGGHITGEGGFCPALEGYARSGTNGFDLWRPNHNEGVEPGWLVLYNWVGGSEPEHVGIVEKILGDHLVAIEGNTSGTDPSDGGMVARMERPYSFTVGYCRPRI
jgi:hypothetical protein